MSAYRRSPSKDVCSSWREEKHRGESSKSGSWLHVWISMWISDRNNGARKTSHQNERRQYCVSCKLHFVSILTFQLRRDAVRPLWNQSVWRHCSCRVQCHLGIQWSSNPTRSGQCRCSFCWGEINTLIFHLKNSDLQVRVVSIQLRPLSDLGPDKIWLRMVYCWWSMCEANVVQVGQVLDRYELYILERKDQEIG